MTGRKKDKTTGTKAPTGPRMDHGWAWVVDFSSFLVYFMSIGYSASLSIYLNIWMDYFDTSAVTAGLVISMRNLMNGIMSPFSGAFCSKFGPRVVTMVGGAIFVVGVVMSPQAPSMPVLIVGSGFVNAIGGSMLYVAAVHVVGMYFKKKFAFAVGLASAGISTGQLVFPPLVTFFIETYGWRGSLLIVAAINLNLIAAGALMRPRVRRGSKKKQRAEKNNTQVDLNKSASERCRNIHLSDEDEIEETDVKDTAMILVKNCPGPVPGTIRYVVAASEDGISLSEFTAKSESPAEHLLGYFSRIKHFLLHTYGLSRLFRNTSFMITMVVAFFHGFARLGVIYIVPQAELVGIDLESSALLLSVFGVGSTVGRIGHGWFIDKRYISGEMVYVLSMFVFCVSVSLMPAFDVFIPLAATVLVLGAMAGISSAVLMINVRAQVLLTDASVALGFMLLFLSVGNVLGVLAAGVAYDHTEQYDLAFFAAGGVLLMASLLALVVYFLQKAKRSKSRVYLPTAFYVKLPRKVATVNLDGSDRDDEGITDAVFMLELGELATSGEGVARPSDEDRQQPIELLNENNLLRHRSGGAVGRHEMGGIENPLAEVQRLDDEQFGTINEDEMGGIENPLAEVHRLGVEQVEAVNENEMEGVEKLLAVVHLLDDEQVGIVNEGTMAGIENPLAEIQRLDDEQFGTINEDEMGGIENPLAEVHRLGVEQVEAVNENEMEGVENPLAVHLLDDEQVEAVNEMGGIENPLADHLLDDEQAGAAVQKADENTEISPFANPEPASEDTHL